MDMMLFDPSLFLVGKVIGGVVVLFLVIGFVPGLVIGWLFGRMSG